MAVKKSKADFYDICKRCGAVRGNVVHCQDCCGWGLTKDTKYHKFVEVSKERKKKFV